MSISMPSYPIMESFYTLQGEGYHQGKAAYFIRFGGCDVGCHWCDVKESWDAGKHKSVDIEDLLQQTMATKTDFVVITGGEPVMYPLEPITKLFRDNHLYLALETSGAYHLSGNWHWICLSPKKNAHPKKEYYELASELKVIIYNKNDFKWAEEHASKVNQNARLYLQAEWSKRIEMTPLIIDYIKDNPKWQLSIQSHKYVNIP